MPIELQIIRASEFVRLDADEHLDFESSKKALQSLALACRKRGLNCALLDLRGLPIPPKPLFTPTQLASLVQSFHEAGFGRDQRLAVLYRSDPHGGARTFAFINKIRGWQVEAFDSFETALQWLSEEPERPEGEIPVPISKRQAKAATLPVALAERESFLKTARSVRRVSHR